MLMHLGRVCWDSLEREHSTAAISIATPSLRFNPAGHICLPHLRGTAICGLHPTSLIMDGPRYSSTPSGGRGVARNNNNNTYGYRGGGQNRNNKLDVSSLGLVSPLGGAKLSSSSALHSTVGVGGLGGLQQATQLGGLLGGGTALTGGASTELAGLCALLGGSQSHGVTF